MATRRALGWVLIGTSAAVLLGMREDLGLLAAGVGAGTWLWASDMKTSYDKSRGHHMGM